jgi:hypothetical protein
MPFRRFLLFFRLFVYSDCFSDLLDAFSQGPGERLKVIRHLCELPSELLLDSCHPLRYGLFHTDHFTVWALRL